MGVEVQSGGVAVGWKCRGGGGVTVGVQVRRRRGGRAGDGERRWGGARCGQGVARNWRRKERWEKSRVKNCAISEFRLFLLLCLLIAFAIPMNFLNFIVE
jgi:hypothetical protein